LYRPFFSPPGNRITLKSIKSQLKNNIIALDSITI
jgi:hypothetical protein